MIIDCPSCNKKFEINSNMISDSGRLLLCSNCNHKWFFKKKVENNTTEIISDVSDKITESFNKTLETEPHLYEASDLNENEPTEGQVSNKASYVEPKNQKKIKILNLLIVLIISFIGIIIILDTFKYPIGKINPNVEYYLYNLYETLKDIKLFINNLF